MWNPKSSNLEIWANMLLFFLICQFLSFFVLSALNRKFECEIKTKETNKKQHYILHVDLHIIILDLNLC